MAKVLLVPEALVRSDQQLVAVGFGTIPAGVNRPETDTQADPK